MNSAGRAVDGLMSGQVCKRTIDRVNLEPRIRCNRRGVTDRLFQAINTAYPAPGSTRKRTTPLPQRDKAIERYRHAHFNSFRCGLDRYVEQLVG